MQRRCWQRPWPRRRVACGMWQVASGGVSCTVISVTVVLAAFVVTLVVAVALALLGNLSTHSDTHPAPPATPPPLLVTPLSHCHPGPNRWFIALLFRRWCRAFCCSAFYLLPWRFERFDGFGLCWSVLILFSFSCNTPRPLSFFFFFLPVATQPQVCSIFILNFIFPSRFSFNFANSSSLSFACVFPVSLWVVYCIPCKS